MNTILDLDREKLRRTAVNFVAGMGLILLYLLMLSLSVALMAGLCLAAIRLLGHVWLFLAILAAAVMWWLTFLMTPHLLDETGLGLRPKVIWLLLPVAPPIFALLLVVHLVGGLAENAPRLLRFIGFAFGIVLLIAAAAGVAMILL